VFNGGAMLSNWPPAALPKLGGADEPSPLFAVVGPPDTGGVLNLSPTAVELFNGGWN
jgi:hypothetical protein